MDNSHPPQQPVANQPETLKLSQSSDPRHFPKILLAGIGAFLVIISALGAGYFLGASKPANTTPQVAVTKPTPTPSNQTENWKIYTSNEFTFKYPPELYVKPADVKYGVTLLFEENVKSIEQLAEKTGQKVNFQEVRVDGIKAYRNENFLDDSPFSNISTLVVYNDKQYQITFLSPKIEAEHGILYDQILSTFKFTN